MSTDIPNFQDCMYFDSASTSYYRPESIGKSVAQAILSFGSHSRGTHKPAQLAKEAISDAKEVIRSFFGADSPEQIAFMSGATLALNSAILGTLKPNDHVITTVMEHNAVLRPLYRLMDEGLECDFVGLLEDGNLDYSAFEGLVKENTKCVIITHCSNVTGLVINLDFLAEFCRKHDLFLILDAAQTAGLFPIDIKLFDRAIICFTGHKGFMGPQGTGGMVVNNVEISPIIRGSTSHSSHVRHMLEYPDSIEVGTPNAHSIAGLLAGARYILDKGMDVMLESSLQMADIFYNGLRGVDGINVLSNFALPHGPIVSFNFNNIGPSEVEDFLNHMNICVRAGFHCAPLIHNALNTDCYGALRFSFSSFNDKSQVEHVLRAVTFFAKNFL